jgi:adenosylcobinamide-GDP ribazoletransferase
MGFLRQYLFAVHAFTRLPVRGSLAQWMGEGPDNLRASAAHFPGVGWLVGIAACAAFALAGLALGDNPFAPLGAAVICLGATLLLTGAGHETGLARTADAFGSAAPAARAMGAAGDSHLGSHGVLALALSVLIKVALLAILAAHSPTAVLAALLAAHVLSRFWPLLLRTGLPWLGARPPADAGDWADGIEPRGVGIAAAWSIVAVAIAWLAEGPAFALAAVAAGGLALLWMRRLFAQHPERFGASGLGATQQACEAATYLGAAIGLGLG